LPHGRAGHNSLLSQWAWSLLVSIAATKGTALKSRYRQRAIAPVVGGTVLLRRCFSSPRIHRCNQLLERLQHSILLALSCRSIPCRQLSASSCSGQSASSVSVSAVSDVFRAVGVCNLDGASSFLMLLLLTRQRFVLCRSGSCRVMSSCLIASSARCGLSLGTTRSRPVGGTSPQPRCDSEDQRKLLVPVVRQQAVQPAIPHLALIISVLVGKVLHQTIGDRLGHWGAGESQ